jgi:hypothetical protein
LRQLAEILDDLPLLLLERVGQPQNLGQLAAPLVANDFAEPLQGRQSKLKSRHRPRSELVIETYWG